MSLAQRLLLALMLTALLALNVGAAVVVNELYYDASGTDTDHEFIELYNNGVEDVDIGGWQLQWGGTGYTTTYTIPAGTIIHAGDYLLLGGSLTQTDFGVTPDLIYSFAFQNGSSSGGGPTDAVRINDLLGYHDTCLYDFPNTNNLEGDRSNPADSLECNPDVAAGHSLSRVTVGYDTDYDTDWADLTIPTPTASQWTPGGASTIASIRGNDANGVPVMLDSMVVITGIITCANQLGTSGPAYMYDNTAAIAVYDNTVNSSGIAIGDSIVVTGWVGFFNGLTEIVDEPLSGSPDVQFTIVSSGHTVDPVVLPPTSLNEANEGQLVRVNGAQFLLSGLFNSGSYSAYVGTDTFTVYVDAQTNLPGTSIPVGPCDIIGALGQYDASSPYFSGYQVNPRFTDDLIFTGGVGPSITNTTVTPYLPDAFQDVIVNARVWDDQGLTGAACCYDAGGGGTCMPIYDDGLHNDGAAGDSVFGGTIPGEAAGVTVNYWIEAYDNSGNTTYDPPTAPTFTYSYVHHDYSVITPIATLKQNDSLGMPTHMDEIHTVIGYLTARQEFGSSGPAHLQSLSNGGDGIAAFDPVISTAPWLIGQQVKVTGWIGFYSGLTQFVDDPNNANYNPVIEVLTTASVTPDFIGDLDSLGEAEESRLVEVRGVRFTATGNFAGSTNYWVTSGADSFTVRIDYDTNIPGTPIPTNPVNVVGILSQFDNSSPYTTGYQLMPRSTADLIAPVVYATLTPDTLPVVVPPGGGSFDYQIDVYNTGSTPYPIEIWLKAELPNGAWYSIAGPIPVTLPAGVHVMRLRTQSVPGSAPAGLYSFRIQIGSPGVPEIIAGDGFAFTKSAVGGDGAGDWNGAWLSDWIEIGENPALSFSSLPDEFALEPAYPNPFNPAATIRFALPEASAVRLEVFDLSGRVVATLADGWRDAGYHQTTFDATYLSSGIYFCRLQAGEFTAMQKLMLVK